jgi:hypothetical protein
MADSIMFFGIVDREHLAERFEALCEDWKDAEKRLFSRDSTSFQAETGATAVAHPDLCPFILAAD